MRNHNLPREKCLRRGIKTLSNVELLSLVIGSGVKTISCFELASYLMQKYSAHLAEASFAELQKIKGIGLAQALKLTASFELAKRLFQKDNAYLQLLTPEQIVLCTSELASYKQEHCVGLYLDNRFHLIHKVTLSKGTLTESLLHPREVFYEAIQAQAACVVVVHNHPSGDPAPSQEDVSLTHQLFEAGELIGITLLDHIIVAGNDFVSMKDKGLLEYKISF